MRPTRDERALHDPAVAYDSSSHATQPLPQLHCPVAHGNSFVHARGTTGPSTSSYDRTPQNRRSRVWLCFPLFRAYTSRCTSRSMRICRGPMG
jgi:hypothetical protein